MLPCPTPTTSPFPTRPLPTTTPAPPTYHPMPVVLSSLSGIVFISCCLLWCCTTFLTQVMRIRNIRDFCRRSDLDPNTNYTVVSCALWLFVIAFASVTAALVVDLVDNPRWQESCDVDINVPCLEYIIGLVMVSLAGTCVLCNCLCYCAIRSVVGYICGSC